MEGCGTITFTDAADYRAEIGGASIDFAFAAKGSFNAHLTWARLPHAYLLQGAEDAAHIGLISFARPRMFVGFPTSFDPPPVWNGVELRFGDLSFQRGGERMHRRTRGISRWGLISLDWEHFAAFATALLGQPFLPPCAGKIERAAPDAMTELLRLHAKACRLAETKPDLIAHQEVIRAIEHDLLHALVGCLPATGLREEAGVVRRHADIMDRFETAFLAARTDELPRIGTLSAAMGVPERTLRACCTQFLGMAPTRYLRLRRLSMVRSALRQNVSVTSSIAEIARRYGFHEPGRFAVAYRSVFGETPSTTVRPHRSKGRDRTSPATSL